MLSKDSIADWFKSLQNNICAALEKADGKALFIKDNWTREEGGGGITSVIQEGNILEKGAVNFSEVYGKLPEKMRQLLGVEQCDFFATGVSIIMHPVSPMVPIIHMNVRYFEMSAGKKWFGGGIDLTPHYVNKNDAKYFHTELKKVCDAFNKEYYAGFKQWADDYFFIKHRNETRGIGGIFFDRLSAPDEAGMEKIFEFVKAVGNIFSPAYTTLIGANKSIIYGEKEKQWQLLRRGRYVEFNLIYDQGTKFGLETNGRRESILLSLPPVVNWKYNYIPERGSKEADTLSLLKKNIDWVNS